SPPARATRSSSSSRRARRRSTTSSSSAGSIRSARSRGSRAACGTSASTRAPSTASSATPPCARCRTSRPPGASRRLRTWTTRRAGPSSTPAGADLMPFDIQGKIGQVGIAGAQYALIKARGDGNCLFHAAGHALTREAHILGQVHTHASFRAAVVAYVEQHAKDLDALGFKLRDGLGITRNAQGAVSAAQGRQIDQRVAYLKGANNWGD